MNLLQNYFLNEKVILLPDLFEKYQKKVEIKIKDHKFSISDIDIKILEHISKWLLCLLKIRFEKCLQVYVPKKKKMGVCFNSNSMDLLNCIYTQKSQEIAVFHPI